MILWGCLDQVNSKSFQRSPQATYRKSSLCCFSLLFLWDSYWMLVWLISLALFIFFLLLPACSSHWIMTIGLFSSLQILYSLSTMLQLKTCRELIILIVITCMARISIWLFFIISVSLLIYSFVHTLFLSLPWTISTYFRYVIKNLCVVIQSVCFFRDNAY